MSEYDVIVIGSGLGGHVDHCQGVIQRAVMVHPRLGDDEDPVSHRRPQYR